MSREGVTEATFGDIMIRYEVSADEIRHFISKIDTSPPRNPDVPYNRTFNFMFAGIRPGETVSRFRDPCLLLAIIRRIFPEKEITLVQSGYGDLITVKIVGPQ